MIPLRALLASCPPVHTGDYARQVPVAKLRLPPFPAPERGLERLATPPPIGVAATDLAPPLLRLVEDLMDDAALHPGHA